MSSSSVHHDPATDAARLLRRVGFLLLVLVLPSVMLLSRRAAAVLAPIGIAILAIAALLDPEQSGLRNPLRAALASPTVLAIAFVLLWAAISIAWTPFPLLAAERLGNAVGIAAMTALAVMALPERVRASTLHLIPIGAFAGAVISAGIAAAMAFATDGRTFIPDAQLVERGLAAVTMLTIVGASWLLSRGHRIETIALLVAMAAAIAAHRSLLVACAYAAGVAAFLLARVNRSAASAVVAAIVVLVVIGLPLAGIAHRYGGQPLAASLPGLAQILDESGRLLALKPLRLVAGHGFDTIRIVTGAGVLPESLPRTLPFELWYELGLLGALGGLASILFALNAMRQANEGLGAAGVGVIAAGFIYTTFGTGIWQVWWLSSLAVIVIALAAVGRGQFRTTRPRVASKPTAI